MKSFMGYMVIFMFKHALSQEIYSLSDFEQKVETGYFNKDGTYMGGMGGIPVLKKSTRFTVCEEFSSPNLSDVCTDWIIVEGGNRESECICSDAICDE